MDDGNHEWRTDEPITCADANGLPETPATCYLNYGSDLNVEMGTLERGKIATVPASGAVGNVKKNITILCTRGAGTTVTTVFKFTPITVQGNNVVSTTSAGLGVAIYYKGKLVSPTPITETFKVGYSNFELEFQVVRDSNVKSGSIPTGDFTAGAVMVMTEM